MNRFRTKKKAKEEAPGGLPSQDGDATPSPSFRGFRRSKKSQEEEPKKKLDLTTVLPSEDDFRTSLLMTNLSARFSMLREQDDPNTKIGKASDDSVLFPKRQSRLGDFGYGAGVNGLSDIAEVESLHLASPFKRTGSCTSDEAGKTGNVMNRPKPMEGNVLFGGRQKIYKIPVSMSTSRGAATGRMPGRALYDDDVARSAFQGWRQEEKAKWARDEGLVSSHGPSTMPSDGEEDFDHGTRGEAEAAGLTSYERKRETSSTTSSALARNSTASNSVVSQPAASLKDWQSASTAPTSLASTPGLERSVARTRRLYEQGLNQELHEQQSSALYRIDTLTRQRTLGNRTSDRGGGNSPSPTTLAFEDRFGDKRPMLTKSSAPNLRSVSPPTSASSTGAGHCGLQAPSQTESKPPFGATPPLSPPMSDGGERPSLSIQPNDRGKATALGVFRKPFQPYDETKYAQRQMQLQQGRETPGPRIRTASNESLVTGRSSSSSQCLPFDAKATATTAKSGSSVSEDDAIVSFLDDASPQLPALSRLASTQHLVQERPSDEDHPAFRHSALPTPLAFGTKMSFDMYPIPQESSTATDDQHPVRPVDSSTLGSNAGLSGLVRQHLRSESNTSSVYGAAPLESDSQISLDLLHAGYVDELGGKLHAWSHGDPDWKGAQASQPTLADLRSIPHMYMDPPINNVEQTSAGRPEETDEFVNQLADARRRVRERLTSFVESDGSRSSSPVQSELVPPQANLLGIGLLRPKGSRGSLIDRSKSIISGPIKGQIALGLGAATMTTSPSPNKPSFEENDSDATSAAPGHVETARDASLHEMRTTGQASDMMRSDAVDETSGHSGLRAFRQARRELQKRREQETMARHPTNASQEEGVKPRAGANSQPEDMTTRQLRQRRYSGDGMPRADIDPQPAPHDNPQSATRTSPRSRPWPDRERDQSASRDGPPPELRKNSTPGLEVPNARAPVPGQRGGLRARSPGLPGTNIRRSPIMPPQAYPGLSRAVGLRPSQCSQAAHALDGSRSVGNLQDQAGQDHGRAAGQPSPMAPLNGCVASALQVPSGSTGNSALGEWHAVNMDISEPTFVMSTSRLPTVNLPPSSSAQSYHTSTGLRSRSSSRSRSNSTENSIPRAVVPPLPPINPRRRGETSRTRAAMDALRGRSRPDVVEDAQVAAPQPPSARFAAAGGPDLAQGNLRSAFSGSDDEDGGRWGQGKGRRKVNTDAFNQNSRHASPSKAQDKAPTFVVRGPPASRSVMAGSRDADGAHRGMI